MGMALVHTLHGFAVPMLLIITVFLAGRAWSPVAPALFPAVAGPDLDTTSPSTPEVAPTLPIPTTPPVLATPVERITP